jgi:(p)ppGpp synthase/HD superfamily hydrolase
LALVPPVWYVLLLHDVVEDTDYTLMTYQSYFGEEVSRIIDGPYQDI